MALHGLKAPGSLALGTCRCLNLTGLSCLQGSRVTGHGREGGSQRTAFRISEQFAPFGLARSLHTPGFLIWKNTTTESHINPRPDSSDSCPCLALWFTSGSSAACCLLLLLPLRESWARTHTLALAGSSRFSALPDPRQEAASSAPGLLHLLSPPRHHHIGPPQAFLIDLGLFLGAWPAGLAPGKPWIYSAAPAEGLSLSQASIRFPEAVQAPS